MIIHKGAKKRLSAETWPTLDLRLALLHETSTAAPTADDEYMSDLLPGANEVVNDDYDRVALAGLAYTWATDHYELQADDTSFGVLAGASLDQGTKTWVLLAHVTDDSDSWIVASETFSPVTFDGTEVQVPWPDGTVLDWGVE